jgi:peptide/nickel transport system substrate-binding protein
MSKKILFLAPVLFLLGAFAFAGGQQGDDTAITSTEGPQHGGTVTLLHPGSGVDPTNWDPFDSVLARIAYAQVFQEPLIGGDVLNRGPRGTGESTFRSGYMPEDLLRGVLAESWEWTDPKTLVFKLRPGVMYYANPNWGFEAREVVATDVEFVMNRFRESSGGSTWIQWMDSAEAIDKYTVVFHCDRYTAAWYSTLTENAFSVIYPPELVDAGIHNWRNQTGTGGFKLTDHVKDVSVSYEKNPDWWNKMQTIDGTEYELPFVDEVVYPIIADESTRIAALRTGKVDIGQQIPIIYRDTLLETSPELIRGDYHKSSNYVVLFQWRHGTWTDRNMRNALQVGTDYDALLKNIYIEGALGYPLNPDIPTSYFTPIEDLPDDMRWRYTYDPERAKQMIIDAGYPNGLDMELVIDTETESADRGNMLKEMWSKIGVNVTLKVVDTVAIRSLRGSGDYSDALVIITGNSNPEGHLEFWVQAPFAAQAQDEYLVEEVKKAVAIMDPVERAAECKRLSLYRMEQNWNMDLGIQKFMNLHWPWVQNYYSEGGGFATGMRPLLDHLWIDEAMKKEMGY